ncbi:uncharacterized protein [Venturia canescens]|uniref:uncharacterized protein n=1 Tax=Venturia canescens TaxID=32260 RepID=UPI001C9CA4FD|nr:uncharacterized protein LOC122412096 [Venturia canescens]
MTANATGAPAENPASSLGQDALSLQISLPEMLDLALGTPEIGTVNLNILHNFLHVLLHQINLRTTKVEYRGDEANRIQAMIKSAKAGTSLQLHEYSIINSGSKTIQRDYDSRKEINADVYTRDVDGVPDSGKSDNAERTAASAPATARGKNDTNKDPASGVSAAKKTSGSKQQISAGMKGERQSVIFVEPVVNGATPTALGFKKLEETVVNLQQRFEALDELAKNPEMIERVRSSKTDPLSDMWHVININKRLDACEKGIEKLTTMVQDLIKGDKIEISPSGGSSKEVDHLNERIVELENQLGYLSGDLSNLMSTVNAEGKAGDPKANATQPTNEESKNSAKEGKKEAPQSSSSTKESGANVPSASNDPGTPAIGKENESPKPPATGGDPGTAASDTSKETSSTKKTDNKKAPENSTAKEKPKPNQERRSVIGGIDLTDLKRDVNALKNEMVEVKKNVGKLNSKLVEVLESPRPFSQPPKDPVTTGGVATVAEETKGPAVPKITGSAPAVSFAQESENTEDVSSPPSTESPSKLSLKRTESRVVRKVQASNRSPVSEPQSYEHSIEELEARVSELEKEIGCVNEKLNNDPMKLLGADGNGGVGDLVAKIQTMKSDMEKMNSLASRLMDEKENRESHTNALIEQIELLKTIKADKEDLEDALADKADARAVNRKVSHDQFDAACDDLARGLEDAITKLSQQESVWQQALDEVQREIEGKLDKIEISPLKDFVNNRLKTLQEKLKALAEMRRENEAAGTKKMLSDVQCISCDANVVMKMEDGGSNYRAPALPCSKSIKPYLTYELDQVRKQQRKLPTSRNMLQFEAAMQDLARKSKPVKEELSMKSPRDHLCNRYCGGSHTITTPQQRVMRMGHFLTQWGPEAIQLTEGVVQGNDGQLYRSRPMPGKSETTTVPGDADGPVEIPPGTPRSPSMVEAGIASQRQSQVIRGRSSIATLPKRTSTRRVSETSREAKNVEIPMGPSTPPSAEAGTTVDDSETVPEPPAPMDEVVREPSLVTNQGEEEEMEMLTEADE